jgi:hypothetical protein
LQKSPVFIICDRYFRLPPSATPTIGVALFV